VKDMASLRNWTVVVSLALFGLFVIFFLMPVAHMGSGYGDWPAVILSVLLLSLFIVAFLQPFKRQSWTSLGITEAFLVSLFTEMFGIPLTIYFLSGFFGIPVTPNVDLLIYALVSLGLGTRQTWELIGVGITATMLLVAAYLIVDGWRTVYRRRGGLVTTGVYGYMRHPQYLGILLISGALILMMTTIPTLIMFPIMTYAYYRLARKEEREMVKKFGDEYVQYERKVPMFIPHPRMPRELLRRKVA
jgi:protein-S-isoprenylcysteine O-methyltransferase Ste14